MTELARPPAAPRTAEWLVCEEVRTGLAELEPILTRRLTHEAPRPVPWRPDLVARGGKRLRASLVLLSGTFGRRREALLQAAMVPELLHTGSLIQDDIMDGADSRRGATALHRVVGSRAASVYATHLYCAAFGIVTGLEVDVRDRAVRAARNLCRGQCLELLSQGDPRLTASGYRRIVAGKTASLFAVSAWLGARVSGSSPRQVRALEGFGRRFGMLYQIVDDLMDLFGDEREIGKPTGGDLKRRVFTLPLVYWLAECPRHPLARRLRSGEALTADQSARLVRDLRKSIAVTRVLSDVDTWTRGAESRLMLLPEGPARESLSQLLHSLSDFTDRLVASGDGSARGPSSAETPRAGPLGSSPAASLGTLLPGRGNSMGASDWGMFCSDVVRRLPWFGDVLRSVERRAEERVAVIDPGLVGRLRRFRQTSSVAEGLAAVAPVLFGGVETRQIDVAAALALLLAAERGQRALGFDPRRRSARILAADFLLCEFMAALSDLSTGWANRMALAAESYMSRVAPDGADLDHRRSSARLHLSLAFWKIGTEPVRPAALEVFAEDKIRRLLEGAERLSRPGVRDDPPTLRAWTRLLREDICRFAEWLRDEQRTRPGVAGRSTLAAGN